MNLDGMLKEGSLTDLSWAEDGMVKPGEITFDPVEHNVKNPNNVKPEAQDQWGYGDLSPIFDEEIAGTVDRNIPEADQADAGPVILFARHLMNQGASASVVDRELKARFTKEAMRNGKDELKELFSMDGLIGRIAIDARGYESCSHALAAADKSPYKGYIKFVMGCSCGDPQMIPVADEKQEMVASTGNAMDDFFADETVHQVKEIPHCRSTMLPLYSSTDGIDPSWMEDLLAVVENISGVPGDDVKKIKMMDEKPIKKIQMAFRMIDKAKSKQARKRYSEPVDASEHVIKTADNEIELFATPQEEIDVDPVNHAIQHEVVPDEAPELRQAHVDMVAEMTEVELAAAAEAQLDGIELSEAGDISLFDKKEAAAPIDVDPTAGDNLGEEFPDILSEELVDMTMAADEDIFEGVDVIELEPERKAQEELDVDMKSEFQW